jgi:BarA-like signal transduction histidine kinase
LVNTTSSIGRNTAENDSSNCTHIDAHGSKQNDLFVVVIVNLFQKVLQVHPEAKIGILTAYTRQPNCYLAAIANMQLAAIPVEYIKVATFDVSQGQQYDFVLMDILVGDQAGFLKDPRRLTVALSRARNGMIIVASTDKTDKLRSEARFVYQVINISQTSRRLGCVPCTLLLLYFFNTCPWGVRLVPTSLPTNIYKSTCEHKSFAEELRDALPLENNNNKNTNLSPSNGAKTYCRALTSTESQYLQSSTKSP